MLHVFIYLIVPALLCTLEEVMSTMKRVELAMKIIVFVTTTALAALHIIWTLTFVSWPFMNCCY